MDGAVDMTVPDDGLPRPGVSTPVRSLWQREPVRVISIVGTFLAAINAVLLGAGAYSGAIAGIITGVLAAALAAVNELFTRAEVVPLRPLEDLAAADKAA